ncbi:Double zinc ribbon [Gimesia alba]|uniref:Double zinc ribbon n=1 Tax=Gimesia alba TaxID=2527973 RepID=A0A517RBM4_9PLAN|nr:zinc ribbon domain-containing protein [Gimesia alba]QDT41289.1 Double zinc ribbon [Gimesia alba]
MTIEFSCSHCDKVLKTSDDKAGRRAKCPQCGEPVTVPQPAATAEDHGFDGFDEFDEPVPEEESFLAGASIDCPMCGESIPADSKKCHHCGETLKEEQIASSYIITVGEVYSRAWHVFKANLGKIIGIQLLAYIASAVATFLLLLILGAIGFAGFLAMGKPNPGAAFVLLFIIYYVVLIVVSSVVQSYFLLGVLSFLLKLVRGSQPGFNELFSGGPYLGRMLLCSLIFLLLYLLGYLCFVIPGIIIALMFWPYAFLLIDRNLPGIKSFTESRNITRGNLLSLFLIYLVMVGITLISYAFLFLVVSGMEQVQGGMAIVAVLFILGFIAAIYLIFIPFVLMVGTVSYAEMTGQ